MIAHGFDRRDRFGSERPCWVLERQSIRTNPGDDTALLNFRLGDVTIESQHEAFDIPMAGYAARSVDGHFGCDLPQ